MDYYFKLKDSNGTDIKVKLERGIFGTKVYFNGNAVRASREKGRPFIIHMSDGKKKRMRVRNINVYDFAPRVLVDGEQVFSAEQLQSYQYIWAGLPLLLFLLGGAIGGLIGVTASLCNLKIFRSDLPAPIQLLSTLGITILSGIVWMFLSIYLASKANALSV